jgi:superfamily II DNA/RNA helicase
MLFTLPAVSLQEQREERRRTIEERCEKVAELAAGTDQSLVWCHLNDEGDRLERAIDGAVQVSGSDPDEAKEERLLAFAHGEIRVLVTKPKIGAWGLNLQRCSHVTFFPSHSYEQYYQGVRRCWRFGQERDVVVDVVTTEGERRVFENLRHKAAKADEMFDRLLRHMNDALNIARDSSNYDTDVEVPAWM